MRQDDRWANEHSIAQSSWMVDGSIILNLTSVPDYYRRVNVRPSPYRAVFANFGGFAHFSQSPKRGFVSDHCQVAKDRGPVDVGFRQCRTLF